MIRGIRKNIALAFLCLIFMTLSATLLANKNSNKHDSAELQKILDNAVASTLLKFKESGFKPDELTAAVIDLKDSSSPTEASYRGEERVYAASVVKMFYMSYYFHLVEKGKLKPTPEVERGLREMIVDSGNEATGYILDVLTGTTSGPELPAPEFQKWAMKRDVVNRYFKSLGYINININQKTHCEDAYGVEQQYRNYKGENRNMLTANASARLMKEIVLGKSAGPAMTKTMLELMRRDWEKPVKDPLYKEFASPALAPGTRLWSKEGFTSKTRHDTVYLETPDGLKLVISIFTENHASEQNIIPNIVREIIKGLGGKTV